jgi:hypothetical protein
VPALRERYLAERNATVRAILDDPKRTATERFWDVLEEMEKEAKILRSCLDDHSRSKMWLHLSLMRQARMLQREDLATFSVELQKQVFGDESEEGSR